jgi:L-alanine-DL-glutamate epimerase-like enolase superfamily enzyme
MQPDTIIKEIGLYRCPVRLKDPFIISLGKLEFADNVIVRIRTSGGLTGFGECSPFLTIHGESGETAIAIGKLLAGKLIGRDATDVSNNMRIMDSIVYANTSIKSAFDIAMHDIAASKSNMPLYEFLGGENNKEMFTDYTVSIGSAERMAADAVKIVNNGFTVVKVKLGGSEEEDFIRLKSIREKIGYEIPVRIDANQGWSVDTAINLLHKFEQFNIEHCEEPVLRHNFLLLPEIRSKSKIPIMADESCFDEMDAKRLVKLNACDLFNVKLGKSSGIYKARKIAEVAEMANINMQAGGFLESRLGFTAMAHFALSSKRFLFFDFDTPLMFLEDPVTGGITYGKKGRIVMPEGLGLGAVIDDNVLGSLEGKIVG